MTGQVSTLTGAGPAQSTRPSRTRSRRQTKDRVVRIVVPLATATVFIGTWAVLAATLYADRNFLVPRPMDVLRAAIEERGFLATATWTTLNEAITGFSLAVVVGIAVAAVMSQSRVLTRSLYPYAVILQTVPIIATAPIIVLWFSFGRTSIVFIATLVSLFPILSNTLAGLVSTDRNQLDLFRLHHASRLTILFKLRFPSALPHIAAGLRISAGMSVIGATVGEFLIGQGGTEGGLGVAIIVSQAQLKTALLFAEAGLATLLGISVFAAANAVTNRALRNWHESALQPEE